MISFIDYIYEKWDYSSVQVKIPENVAKKMRAFGKTIPDSEITAWGRTEHPHVTVKYGLHSASPDVLQQVNLPKKLTGRMSAVTVFENPKFDVIKVDIISPDIMKFNKMLTKELPNTQTFKNFHAHATIAFVKKGFGKKYAGDKRFKGEKLTFKFLEFSSKDSDDGSYQRVNL